MIFWGAPRLLTIPDLKEAKEKHPYIDADSSQWRNGYRVKRWDHTIAVSFDPLLDLIMAPSSQRAEFNMMVKRLSKAKYHSNWFKHCHQPWRGDDISIPKDASTVELQPVRSAICILSGHRSLEVVNKHLQLAYIFAMSDSAEKNDVDEHSGRRSTSGKQEVPPLSFLRLASRDSRTGTGPNFGSQPHVPLAAPIL
jgi:hypothetical protein